ncbi:hypothetical protein OY671_009515, partial [Metschnikowia pulcherrima]
IKEPVEQQVRRFRETRAPRQSAQFEAADHQPSSDTIDIGQNCARGHDAFQTFRHLSHLSDLTGTGFRRNMAGWLTAEEVMSRLGLRAQTLYAYVSRGRIEARRDADDPRRSLYRASDVDRLQKRRARGRGQAAVAEEAIAWGEPVSASAITTIADGKSWYRGRNAASLAETASLEGVARSLWDCGNERFP